MKIVYNMKYYFYLLYVFYSIVGYSQSISPHIINSAGGGGPVGSSGVEVYYNIGEPLVSTVNNGANAITQGFLQPDIVGDFGLNVSALTSNESCLSKNDGKINLTLNTQPSAAYTLLYIWTPSSICPTNNCLSLDSLAPGNYSVIIKAINSSSLTIDSVSKNFVITANTDPCQITVFSGFSPNGDGMNDAWIIEDIENFPNNNVTIYNRWGNKLAHFTNYDNKNNVWKGETSSGTIVSSGTYFYVIELNSGSGYKKGWVEVTGK
jgi:gliding motility-associated-like protein